MSVDLIVGPPYPCWIEFWHNGDKLRISHCELLEMERAVAEAKRLTLMKLPRSHWHEVDSMFAQGAA